MALESEAVSWRPRSRPARVVAAGYLRLRAMGGCSQASRKGVQDMKDGKGQGKAKAKENFPKLSSLSTRARTAVIPAEGDR
eukprot:s866_g13.t1